MANGGPWAAVGKWGFTLLYMALLALWVTVGWTVVLAYYSGPADEEDASLPSEMLGGALAVGTAAFLLGLVPVGAMLAGVRWFWKEAPLRLYLYATALAATVLVVGVATLVVLFSTRGGGE
jgi:hypothetical protein